VSVCIVAQQNGLEKVKGSLWFCIRKHLDSDLKFVFRTIEHFYSQKQAPNCANLMTVFVCKYESDWYSAASASNQNETLRSVATFASCGGSRTNSHAPSVCLTIATCRWPPTQSRLDSEKAVEIQVARCAILLRLPDQTPLDQANEV